MQNFIYMLEDAAASGSTAATPSTADMWTMPILLVVFIGAMYFFMIRPQKKQEKKMADMRNNLMIGDEVTTNGGILGRVVHVKDDVVTIETGSDRIKIKVRKWAIATVDKKIDEKPNVPKGGFKVTGVKKSDEKKDSDKPELK